MYILDFSLVYADFGRLRLRLVQLPVEAMRMHAILAVHPFNERWLHLQT